VGSKQLVDIIVKIGVEHVFTSNPIPEKPDNRRLDQHQDFDGAWSDRLYWTPRRTQSAIGLYAHDDEYASRRGFEKIVPLLGCPRERNVMERSLTIAGRLQAR
jgi:hypothetical protein